MNDIDTAIHVFDEDRTPENLANLENTLLAGKLIVPVFQEAKELSPGRWDVRAMCIRRSNGSGAILAFTSLDQLFAWKRQGSKYVELTGRALIEMARGMPEVDEVAVNPFGVPQGAVPRSEFERLLS